MWGVLGCLHLGWVVKDPKQHGGVGGQIIGEPAARQPQGDGQAGHDGVAHPGGGVEVSQYGGAQPGRLVGEQVGAMQRDARPHPGIVVG